MVLRLRWAQKRVLWVVEKSIFWLFANFSLKKLKLIFRKVRQSIQSYLSESLVIGSFLENTFEAILSWKTSVVIVWKERCSVFCKFLSDKVERISWESEANVQHYLNKNLLIGSFLETCFEATLSSKKNVLSV